MNSVTVKYYGVDGTGRTVKEAKVDAGRKIEAAFDRNYNPEIVKIGDEIGLLWATPFSYCYRIITDTKGILFGSFREGEREGVKQEMRNHLLQLSWKPEYGLNHPDASKDELRDLQSWFEFQLRYKAAKSKGMSDNDAHDYAGRNPARCYLWKEAI